MFLTWMDGRYPHMQLLFLTNVLEFVDLSPSCGVFQPTVYEHINTLGT